MVKSFKRVKKLYDDKVPLENIASDLEMGKNLVREYIEIIEESKKKGGKQ